MGGRSTEHRELREAMKVHFMTLKESLIQEAHQISRSSDLITSRVGRILLPIYQSMTMRELWKLTRIYQHAVWRGMREPYESPRHELEVALYQAGVNLYGHRSRRFLARIEEERREIMMDKLRDPR